MCIGEKVVKSTDSKLIVPEVMNMMKRIPIGVQMVVVIVELAIVIWLDGVGRGRVGHSPVF
jgi:hypothetical protein